VTLRTGVAISAYPDGLPSADWWWRFAERAEALGFDSLWAGEHVVFHAATLSAPLLLAGFAARTRGIRLGTAIYLLPLRQPVLAAKELVTLDQLTGGRLIVGVGVGGEHRAEFEACGVPLAERGSRTDEAIALVRRLWREERVTAAGRHFAVRDVTLTPRPRQPGGPPIWIGGRSAAALRRTARTGDGYLPYLMTPAALRASNDRLDALCADAGRDPAAIERGLVVYVNVDDDRARAVRGAASALTRVYRQPFEPLVERYVITGPPEACAERIAEYRAAGARHLVFNWACSTDQVIDQMGRVATLVRHAS
jgi:probable F420-dependent oxidoreductase